MFFEIKFANVDTFESFLGFMYNSIPHLDKPNLPHLFTHMYLVKMIYNNQKQKTLKLSLYVFFNHYVKDTFSPESPLFSSKSFGEQSSSQVASVISHPLVFISFMNFK